VFGAFVAALLAAKIVNINIGNVSSPDGLNISLCLVLGFLSGFSERFSRGFIRMAEDRLGPGQDRDPKLKVLTEAVLATGKSSAASVA
jgi:hypothetical protein